MFRLAVTQLYTLWQAREQNHSVRQRLHRSRLSVDAQLAARHGAGRAQGGTASVW